MAFKRITENDMLGKGNVGKPDTPGVSTSEMQRIMDELPREVIAPAFNELSGQLEADTASADIGANAPDGITPDPAPAENSPAKLQSVLQGIVNKITDHIADHVKHVASEERTSWNNASNDRHTHDNKSILDGITSSLVGNWNAAFAHVSDAVRHITENERTNWNDKYTKSETDKAINERVVEIGSSDMTKAVYDPETRNLPYIPKIDAEALTLGKNVVLSGTPVSIAYAGANRIDALTLYGENAQGGTTEAPVALTGITSVTVNDDVTELPIPRPLRRVGDVKDKCVTRVKSECDKKIVFDGSADEDWSKIVVSGIGTIWRINQSDAFYRQTPLSNIYPSVAYVTFRREGVIYIQSVKEVNVIDILDSSIDTIENWRAKLSSTPLTVYYQSTAYDGTNGLDVCMTEYQTGYIESYAGESITTAWISSTGALSTGAEVAYVLSSPETYATDPVDFDNTAGPLTVMTGGELEVRMTELIGTRSDVSNNTVAFSEASQDADIQTGEKLSVLFGKIKKRLSLLQAKADNSLQTTVKTVIGAINEVLGRTKATKTTLNASDALSPTGNGIAYVYTQGDMKTLLAEMSSLGNFDAGRTLFVFAGDLRPSSMICFTGFIDRAPKTFFIYPNGELKTLETSITLNQTLVLNVTYK